MKFLFFPLGVAACLGFISAAQAAGSSHYVGKHYTVPQAIDHIVVFSSTDLGFSANGSGTCTLTLMGKHTAPASATDGTAFGTVSFADSNTFQSKTITSTDQNTVWEYVWVAICAPRRVKHRLHMRRAADLWIYLG